MYPKYPYYGYETKCENKPVTFPSQHQDRQPGLEYLMVPTPISDNPWEITRQGRNHYGGRQRNRESRGNRLCQRRRGCGYSLPLRA